jgi:hypothetical protein
MSTFEVSGIDFNLLDLARDAELDDNPIKTGTAATSI